MGVLWLIVFAVAVWYAAKGSYNGVRGAYSRRMATWAKAHPNANGAARRAAAVGNMAALAVYGGPALYHGWRTGWSDGWGSGKEWAAQHRPAKPEPQPVSEPGPVATMAPARKPAQTSKGATMARSAPAKPCANECGKPSAGLGSLCDLCADCAAIEDNISGAQALKYPPTPISRAEAAELRVSLFGVCARGCGQPICEHVGQHGNGFGVPASGTLCCYHEAEARQQQTEGNRPHLRAVPTTNPRSTDMAVETATGGEVTNAETNLAEANAAVREYSADFEDASADAQRAKEDLARVETWHASMGRSRAPQARVGEVAALIEPAQARLSAAQARQRAAEGSLAAAKAVQASAARDVELMGQAVGSWYGN